MLFVTNGGRVHGDTQQWFAVTHVTNRPMGVETIQEYWNAPFHVSVERTDSLAVGAAVQIW
jgi:hypothetical protein